MANNTIAIHPDHLGALARMQHVLEHLSGERARLSAELAYIARETERREADVVAFLQRAYGLDAAHVQFSLDTEHGVIVTPESAPPALRVVEPAAAVDADVELPAV